MFKALKNIIFKDSVSIKEILKSFEKYAALTGGGFAIIENSHGKCVGVVTDGDIRRRLLKNSSMDEPVSSAMNRDFVHVLAHDSNHKILRQFDKNINILPVLKNGFVVDLYKYSNFMASSRFEEKIIRARVPVRVSYSGGGADMSDYINENPAMVLSSTINKYCTASILVREDDEIHIHSKDLNITYKTKSLNDIRFGDDLDLIKSAIKIMQPKFGFNIETYAEFEPGTGLGGSSSVVVSVLGALNYFRNEKQLDVYQLADLAYQVERIDMRINGGWQDQYATAFGGFSWIEFFKNKVIVNPINLQRSTQLELEYNLMLFKLGKNRKSSLIQKNHIKNIKSKSNEKMLSKMVKLAKKMKESLLLGNVKKFADLLHDSWVLKQRFNNQITNDYIENCYQISRNLGALGGKLLGAGMSGYLLIYASPLYQNKIRDGLKKEGAIYEPFKFSNAGLEVWSTNR